MTPSEHLGELKGIDPETYEALRNYPIYCSDDEALTVNLLESRNNILVMDALQGCIQRACERRGWTWRVFKQTPDNEKSHCGEIGKVAPGYEGDYYEQYHEYCIASIEADSPAEALLAAYIAAIRAEAKL